MASFFQFQLSHYYLNGRTSECHDVKGNEFKDYSDFMRVWLLIDTSGVCQVYTADETELGL